MKNLLIQMFYLPSKYSCFRRNKKAREQKKKLRDKLAGKLADASGDSSVQEQDLFELNLMRSKQVSLEHMFVSCLYESNNI